MTDGFRESTQSWREVLLDLKRRGLKQDPKLAIGDGALGFWTALREVFATTREQRCWVHKTMNVLNAMPKSVQAKAKGHLHDIWQAETKAKANAAFDFFVATYGVKWDKAVAKLVKDRDALLTFYDYPAEHWKHIRTSNPIESPGLRPFWAELIHWINSQTPITLRDGPASHETHEGMPQPEDRAGHGLQADDVGAEEMAQTRRPEPPARDHPRG